MDKSEFVASASPMLLLSSAAKRCVGLGLGVTGDSNANQTRYSCFHELMDLFVFQRQKSVGCGLFHRPLLFFSGVGGRK